MTVLEFFGLVVSFLVGGGGNWGGGDELFSITFLLDLISVWWFCL